MSDKTKIPASALYFGLAGLLPFWAPVAASLWSLSADRSNAAEAWIFTLYAGLILTFLGGVRWGAEIVQQDKPDGRVLALSIAPSLIALLAGLVHFLAGAAVAAWLLLIIGLFLQYRWDTNSARSTVLPIWYGRLRVILSVGAISACAAMVVITRLI
ncbi:MAG: DUF3429 domain-containing protein [Alphaproteobacteria bacterium]|nr:DUF3429 domain-containing protein [Alphaproteobacteria bacterium]